MYDEQRVKVGDYIRLKGNRINYSLGYAGSIAVVCKKEDGYNFVNIKLLSGKHKGKLTIEFIGDGRYDIIPEKVALLEVL